MINPLNELSSVYNQSIAEGCGCDEKKKEKKVEMIPQGKTPMGGDGARPGKNAKGYVEPMGEEKKPLPTFKMRLKAGNLETRDEKSKDKAHRNYERARKIRAVVGEAKKDDTYLEPDMKKRQANNEKARKELAKGPQMKNPHFEETEVNEGHCEEKGVECSPVEKKKDSKKSMKEHFSWRDELREVAYGNSVADREDLVNMKPKDSDESREEIKEKKIKNKIKINPPQGMTEAFAEIGAEIVEMYEIEEKIDLKKADMGEVIKDFRKSDAPQFKGKSDKKIRQMAIAAKLDADEEGGDMMGEETEEEKKKRELMARTKEHDDKRDGKLAEGDFPKDAPSIKDEKQRTQTFVKRYPGLGYAPTIKKEELSIDDQMRISRDAAKNRNPKPDHKAIRAKMLKKPLPKDTRTDAEKMTDAVGKPRMGSSD